MLRLLTLGRLSVEPEAGVPPGGPRPRRLALLAILASCGSRGMSRDQVLAILWPESDEEKGRHALSQTLYSLRRDLGRDVVVGTTELRLDPSQVRTDLDDLQQAIACRQWERVLELYRGPFVDGFYLTDDPGFGEWVDAERRRIEVEAHAALESGAAGAESAGDLALARRYWTRLTLADPLSGRYALGLMNVLVAQGDRAGALAHAREHAGLVRRELDVEPDNEVRRLTTALRAGAAPREEPPQVPGNPTPAKAESPVADLVRNTETTARWRLVLLMMVIVAAGLGVVWALAGRNPAPPRPVLAVGTLRDLAAPDTVQLSGVLGEMLSTSLARLTQLDIVASTRILQLLPPDPDPSGRARVLAAREAGATEILEGEITPVGPGLRLDLRRIGLASGRVWRGYVVTAADRFALIDSATAAVARDLDLAAPSRSVADVTTRSPIAFRLYEEGLRAYYQLDQPAASRLFRAALEEDSTFALAAYYAWRSATDQAADSLGHLALRLTDRAPERERLLMRVQITGNDPAVLAVAETLAVRYPNDPEALIRSAVVYTTAMGPVAWVVATLERAIAIDSASIAAPHRDLRLSDAFKTLVERYNLEDSSGAVLRTVRRWTGLQPNSAMAWHHRAIHAELAGLRDEAEQALARFSARSVPPPDPVTDAVWRGVHRGEPGSIREACESSLRNPAETSRWGVHRWYCVIGYRHLGQQRAALALINREVILPSGASLGRDLTNDAILDFEMGPALAGGPVAPPDGANPEPQAVAGGRRAPPCLAPDPGSDRIHGPG